MSDAAAREGSSIALLLAYDGTEFAGWQIQPEARTVQGELERVLGTVHGTDERRAVAVVGSGRTDAGVHAAGQVAAYRPPTERDVGTIHRAANALLSESIRVLAAAEMPAAFHPCRSATGKIYSYRIVNRPILLPFEARWSWHVRAPLDLDAVGAAAQVLEGRHDFASFASAGGQSETTVRTMRRIGIRAGEDGSLELSFEADGFLYRMVRNIVGLLVEIGLGRRRASEVAEVLELRRRSAAGLTAPARGLCLRRALYADADAPPWEDAELVDASEAKASGWFGAGAGVRFRRASEG